MVNDCHQTLQDLIEGQEPHWTHISIAFSLGTGRRMVEVHALGEFEVTGEYELHFSGQAKTRGAEGANDEYYIPTLFPSLQLLAALEYLEREGRRIDGEEQKRDRLATNRAFGMALSHAMEKYEGINYFLHLPEDCLLGFARGCCAKKDSWCCALQVKII